jgi:hypothetical protein
MAINDGGYDPSRRIRATLGEEFSSNLENEAIARLSSAMASNGIRSKTSYDEMEDASMNIDRIREITKNIKHTNPITNPIHVNEPLDLSGKTANERVIIRKNAFTNSCANVSTFTAKKKVVKTALTSVTGVSIGESKKVMTSSLAAFGLDNVMKAVQNDTMESSLRYGNIKAIGITSAANVIGNFLYQGISSGNLAKVSEMFDTNVITSAEAQMISKVIRNEKLKFAAQHTAATVILPTLLKAGIDKLGGEKIKNSPILSAVTSFGTLSEIGNIGLKIVRKINEKKLINKNPSDQDVLVDEASAIEQYKYLARVAINHSINETITSTIPGSILGSYIGYKAVTFEYPEESETTMAINKYLSDEKKETEVPKEVKEKPAASTKKTEAVKA